MIRNVLQSLATNSNISSPLGFGAKLGEGDLKNRPVFAQVLTVLTVEAPGN